MRRILFDGTMMIAQNAPIPETTPAAQTLTASDPMQARRKRALDVCSNCHDGRKPGISAGFAQSRANIRVDCHRPSTTLDSVRKFPAATHGKY